MHPVLHLLPIAAVAAAVAALLCILLRPLLVRYAMARPSARSSHSVPTPQGGGIPVLSGLILALALAGIVSPRSAPALHELMPVLAAAVLLAVVGAWDDIRPLSPGIRLGSQALCVGIVLIYAAPGLRLFPDAMPLVLERGLALLAGIWFVNLVNFMDGIDWITLAGILPLTGALALAGTAGIVDPATGWLAAALCGALLGFAPFNKPAARLFLGDVGSLPIGLLTAYLLYRLAGTGALAAALLLPLYHVCDATITLLRRLWRRERVWEAHRSHFYQQATVNGYSVGEVVAQVALLNLCLVGLAALSLRFTGLWEQLACLVAGLLPTALLLRRFATRRARLG